MDSDNVRLRKTLIAGTGGGVAQVLVGQPFDTVKVRMQVTQQSLSGVLRELRGEGLRTLYRGAAAPLVGAGVDVAIQFASSTQARAAMLLSWNSAAVRRKEEPRIRGYESVLAGCFAGACHSFVASPMEHLRIRLQLERGATSSGPTALLKQITREHGIARGFYHGLGATFAREVPAVGIYFGVYDAMVRRATPANGTVNDVPWYTLLGAGAFAGTQAWVWTFPMDVIKTKLQSDAIRVSERQYHGWVDVATRIARTSGWRGFFPGFWVCMARAVPTNAATFYTFESIMRFMGGRDA